MKKIISLILTLLISISCITINTNRVEAEGGYELTGDSVMLDLFDLSPLLNVIGSSGYAVAYMKVTLPTGNVVDAYCIEPDVPAHLHDLYNGSFTVGNAEAGQVILNYYQNYRNHHLFSSQAGYYAVQLAVWGRIKNVDPATLVTKSGLSANNAALAPQIKSLASDLYNDGRHVGHDLIYNYNGSEFDGGGAGNVINLYKKNNAKGSFLYKREDDGKIYLRSELFDLYTDPKGTAGDLTFTVTVQNGFVSNAYNDILSTSLDFGLNSKNGTRFYIWRELNTENQTIATLNGDFNYVDLMTWEFASSPSGATRGQKLMSLGLRDSSINDSIYFTSDELDISSLIPEETEFKADLNITNVVKAYGAVQERKSAYSDLTLHSLATGVSQLYNPSPNTYFTMYKVGDDLLTAGVLDRVLYKTRQDGKTSIVDLPLDNTEATHTYYLCEMVNPIGTQNDIYSPKGTDISSLLKKSTEGFSCLALKIATNKDFTGNYYLGNTENTLGVTVEKKDVLGQPVKGAAFGIFNTGDITLGKLKGDGTSSEIDTVIPAGSLIAEFETDESGVGSFTDLLFANQDYIIRELNQGEATAQFNIKGHEEIQENEFIIEASKQTDLNKTYELEVTNIYKRDLDLIKTNSETGDPIEGAEFTLSNENTVYTVTTDSEGKATFKDVLYGDYVLNESLTPAGYQEIETMDVEVNGSTEKIEITNTPYPVATFNIKKVVIEDKEIKANADKKNFKFIVSWGPGEDQKDEIFVAGNKTYTYKKTLTESTVFTITEEDLSLNENYKGYSFDDEEYTIDYQIKEEDDVLKIANTPIMVNKDSKTVNEAVFTNNYKANEYKLPIPVSKEVIDADGKQVFAPTTFKTSYKDLDKNVTYVGPELSQNSSVYWEMTFHKAGTFNYEFWEVNDLFDGVTYDSTHHKVTIVIEDNNSELSLKSITGQDGKTIEKISLTNVWDDPTTEVAQVPVSKVTDVKPYLTEHFYASILDVNTGRELAYELNPNGDDTLIPIAVNKPGSFDFVIKEVIDPNTALTAINGDAIIINPGWEYDSAQYYVNVVVEKEDDNLIAKKVTISNDNENGLAKASFSNHFTGYSDFEKDIDVNKVTDFDTDDTFYYVVNEDYDNVKELKTDAPYPFTFTANKPGKYFYTIREDIKSDAGKAINDKWKVDDSLFEYKSEIVLDFETRKLVEKEGSLVKKGVEVDEIKFNNTLRDPNSAHFAIYGRKYVEGTNLKDNFTILAYKDEIKEENICDDEHFAGHGSFVLEADNIKEEGNLKYFVVEQKGNNTRYEYDSKVYEIDVVVEKVGEKYQTTSIKVDGVDYNGTDEVLIFTNKKTYKNVEKTLVINKEWTDLTNKEAEKLSSTFHIESSAYKGSDVVIKGNDSQSITLEFDYSMLDGDVSKDIPVVITETTCDGTSVKCGTNKKQTIKYTLSEDTFELKCEPDKEEELTWINEVVLAPAEDVISIEKQVKNETDSEQVFIFTLKNLKDSSQKETHIKGVGTAEFTEKFTAAGDYEFELQEIREEDTGYSYDLNTYTISYHVVKDVDKYVIENKVVKKNGVLIDTPEKFIFVNSKGWDKAIFELPIEKTWTNLTNTEAGNFTSTFTATGADVPTLTIKGAGNVVVKYSFTKPVEGEFISLISEKDNVNERVRKAEGYKAYTLYLTVEDAGSGVLKITSNLDKVSFTNTYDWKTAKVELPIKKVVNGKPDKDEEFIFLIDNKEITGSIKGSGTMNYYKTLTEGSYSYTITEKNTKADNYTYDKSVYTVTVDVHKKGLDLVGTTVIKKDGKNVDEILFTNVYTKPNEDTPSTPTDPKKVCLNKGSGYTWDENKKECVAVRKPVNTGENY